ncbi:YceI family protein [Prauserella halophila]|uniref:YceI family protein n=1 Tax=Prauserella halophila TaxID=185641 RepID=A0ABP4GXU2_9PSEU|nr:YceI family protein [Prauserella halophila]MCP2236868.1 Polyisoprenoid-binding protein YceI [Prauserella halophila]
MPGLSATVRTTDGWGIEHAVLTVTDLGGRQAAHAAADAQGVVSTDLLQPGVYTAVVTAAGHLPIARTAQVGSTGGAELGELVLEPEEGAIELPPTGPWVIDPVHSSVQFAARHLGISSVRGRFGEIQGQVQVARPVEQSLVRAQITAGSIDTGIKMRDDHLRSADFLEVDEFPTIDFVSTGLVQRGSADWTMEGELTLHGERKPVTFEMTYGGYGPDPWGGTRAAFHAETQLRREDFAINYNAMVRAGVAAVGTTVKVEIDIQLVQGEQLPEM